MYSSEKKVESLKKDKIKFYVLLFCYSAAQTNSYKTVLKNTGLQQQGKNWYWQRFLFSLPVTTALSSVYNICDIMYF